MAEFDPSRAKPETWQKAVRALLDSVAAISDERCPEYLRELRQQCRVPLRTRAEVDAEIVNLVRRWTTTREPLSMAQWLDRHCGQLDLLASEPTAPGPTELGACPPDCDECAQEAEAAAEPCSCEESLALKAQLERCRAIVLALRQGEVSGEAAARALERELGRGDHG